MERIKIYMRACLLTVCVFCFGWFICTVYGNVTRYNQRLEQETAITALDVYNEHTALLDMAAEILWSHPEVFERMLGEGEYIQTQCKTSILLSDEFNHDGIADADWQLVRDAITVGNISSVAYYFPRHNATAIYLFFSGTNHLYHALVYIRSSDTISAEEQKHDVAERISELRGVVSRVEETDYQYWYQDVRNLDLW